MDKFNSIPNETIGMLKISPTFIETHRHYYPVMCFATHQKVNEMTHSASGDAFQMKSQKSNQ